MVSLTVEELVVPIKLAGRRKEANRSTSSWVKIGINLLVA